MRIVSVCENACVFEVLGEKILRPIERHAGRIPCVFAAGCFVFAMKDGSKIALWLRRSSSRVSPRLSRMALDAMDENNTVISKDQLAALQSSMSGD